MLGVVPSGTNGASKGSRLKLTVVRKIRAGHLPRFGGAFLSGTNRRARPKHEQYRHLTVVHNEPPRCEDRRLIDAKFDLVMNVEMHSDRSFRSTVYRHQPV